MGIILSALSGAGTGINQIGVQDAKNIDEINKADMIARNNYERLEENRQKDAAAVNAELAKIRDSHLTKNLPAPAEDAAADVLDKYNQAKQAAIEKFDADPMNRVHAAVNAGQIEHAAALAKLASEGQSVVGYGGVKVDSSGNIIYDNSTTRAENDTTRANKPKGSGLASGSSERTSIAQGNLLTKAAKDDQLAYDHSVKALGDMRRGTPEYEAQKEVVSAFKDKATVSAARRDAHLDKNKKSDTDADPKPSSAKTNPGSKADYSNLF